MQPRKRHAIRTYDTSKDGQKGADFEGHAQITHPTQGLDLEKLSQGMAKFHFSNIPNTGRR
jgi:hypothetical protein